MAVTRILREARCTKDAGLTVTAKAVSRAVIVAFAGAAWANAQEKRTRGGSASPLDSRSQRIWRVRRSTFAAEAMAMDAGV
eukprot:2820040-Pyramimonas_sp.AAC.1